MSTNHTEHYSLCQWLATDQVQRTDFNQDNLKIDTALKGLADRTGLVPLSSITTTEDSNNIQIPLEVDWAEWKLVHVDIIPAAGSSDQVNLCFSGTPLDSFGLCSTKWTHLILMPYGQPEVPLTAVMMGNSASFFRSGNLDFDWLSKLFLIGEKVSYHMKAGTVITVRGEPM